LGGMWWCRALNNRFSPNPALSASCPQLRAACNRGVAGHQRHQPHDRRRPHRHAPSAQSHAGGGSAGSRGRARLHGSQAVVQQLASSFHALLYLLSHDTVRMEKPHRPSLHLHGGKLGRDGGHSRGAAPQPPQRRESTLPAVRSLQACMHGRLLGGPGQPQGRGKGGLPRAAGTGIGARLLLAGLGMESDTGKSRDRRR